jgi:hypothetical protein
MLLVLVRIKQRPRGRRSAKRTAPCAARGWATTQHALGRHRQTLFYLAMFKPYVRYIECMNIASKLGPHTQTDRGTCPGMGSEFTTKAATERRRYLIVVPRPMPAAPRRYLIVLPKPMPAAARRYLIVVLRPSPAPPLVVHRRYFDRCARPLPAAPIVVRCRYLIAVPRPLHAAALSLHRRAEFINRGAQVAARGGARCISQVLGRGAQVAAAAPRRCRSRRRKTLLMCSG